MKLSVWDVWGFSTVFHGFDQVPDASNSGFHTDELRKRFQAAACSFCHVWSCFHLWPLFLFFGWGWGLLGFSFQCWVPSMLVPVEPTERKKSSKHYGKHKRKKVFGHVPTRHTLIRSWQITGGNSHMTTSRWVHGEECSDVWSGVFVWILYDSVLFVSCPNDPAVQRLDLPLLRDGWLTIWQRTMKRQCKLRQTRPNIERMHH